MKRRDFISLLGSAAAWPLAARAQQMRRIGVFMNLPADDQEGQARLAAFHQGLQELGWVLGRNVRIDYRWGFGDRDRNRAAASELVGLAPDLILAAGNLIDAVRQETRTIPIVFTGVIDPVGRGLVESLAWPGGNATGFTPFEFSLNGKLLELLTQVAPNVKRVAVLRDTVLASAGIAQFAVIQAVAPTLGVDVSAIDVREPGEIERAITAFAVAPNSGLVVPLSTPTQTHHKLIITLAARHRLPAIYTYRVNAADGGLLCYGPDDIEPYRQAAGYVDRILKGEKPADLPVQAPTKYQLTINLKTAKALGLDIPAAVLARADEVIE
jgi:putative ABC transport system substrate-binding protein